MAGSDSKILFLGTGGDAIVVGKQERAAGGIVLKAGENQFLIDPGPGCLAMARATGTNLRETTAVFVSHNHLNHAGEINAVLSAMTHGGLDKHGVLVGARSAMNKEMGRETFLLERFRDFAEKSIAVEPGQKLAINDVEILVAYAKHTDSQAVGFKFFTDKFILSYTGDTAYSKELADFHKESDIIVLNVKLPSGAREEGSMGVDDAAKFLSETKPQLAIITHFGVKMLKADPLNEARNIQKTAKVQTIAANDGVSINPVSYAAGLRTKTLNLY